MKIRKVTNKLSVHDEISICACGTIHFIPNDKFDKAIHSGKEIMLICANCGNNKIMGADEWEEINENGKHEICYNLYTRNIDFNYGITQISFDNSLFKRKNTVELSEILYSKGYRVPMESGEYASYYGGDWFIDQSYLETYKFLRKDLSKQEVFSIVQQEMSKKKKVNMERFIRETPEEVLNVISNYYIKAFNWSGTKYEKKF